MAQPKFFLQPLSAAICVACYSGAVFAAEQVHVSQRLAPIVVTAQTAHDANGLIVDASIMKGVTIFARPTPLSALIHARIPLSERMISGLEPSVREAVSCALSTK